LGPQNLGRKTKEIFLEGGKSQRVCVRVRERAEEEEMRERERGKEGEGKRDRERRRDRQYCNNKNLGNEEEKGK